MERGAWWATVHGVAKSWTWLNDWASMHSVIHFVYWTNPYWAPTVCQSPHSDVGMQNWKPWPVWLLCNLIIGSRLLPFSCSAFSAVSIVKPASSTEMAVGAPALTSTIHWEAEGKAVGKGATLPSWGSLSWTCSPGCPFWLLPQLYHGLPFVVGEAGKCHLYLRTLPPVLQIEDLGTKGEKEKREVDNAS